MKTHVEFCSDKFPPYEDEEELINPGLWGKRLAEYLKEKLKGEGIESGELNPEDWGWRLPLNNDAFSMWIGCGHLQEQANSYLIFVEPSQPIIRKLFKKIDTTKRVGIVVKALDKILASDPEISNLSWRDENKQ